MYDLGSTRPITPEARKRAFDGEKKEEVITVEIKAGDTLKDDQGDSYRILKMLGQGGMGGVFKVEEERTGMVKAIKFMNSRHREVPEMITRFDREIKTLANLHNPFILAAHDVTHFDIDGERLIGFVTDCVDGPSVADELSAGIPMKPKKVVTLVAQMTVALESLREVGLVHRDLKPANIYLEQMSSGEQFVRIGDFGIVSFGDEPDLTEFKKNQDKLFAGDRDQKLTKDGYVVGSPQYMSPEATQGQSVDHRSDLYSLGIVLYEMITGKPPFIASSPIKLIHKQMLEDPQAFAKREVTDVPLWLEEITMKLLSKIPDWRYQTSMEVYQALKDGVRKDYPELLKEIPFNWDFKNTDV